MNIANYESLESGGRMKFVNRHTLPSGGCSMSLVEQGPRRSPTAGGYARGVEARVRIVAAALKVFGEQGYEGASTRQIAEEAGVKPAALQYYFHSKEGLHRACAEHMLAHAEGLDRARKSAEAAIEEAEQAGSGPQCAVIAFCDLLDAIVDFSLDKKNDPGREQFMARIQADGAGPALEVIRENLARPLQALCVRLVAAALAQDPGDVGLRLRATLLLCQVSSVHAARENTLRLLGWKDFDHGNRELLKSAMRANTIAALTPR